MVADRPVDQRIEAVRREEVQNSEGSNEILADEADSFAIRVVSCTALSPGLKRVSGSTKHLELANLELIANIREMSTTLAHAELLHCQPALRPRPSFW